MAKRSVCEVCGNTVEAEVSFCPECGSRMTSEMPAAAEPFSGGIPPVPPAGNAPVNNGYAGNMGGMPVNSGYIPNVNNMPMNNGCVPPMNNMPVNNGYIPPAGAYGMPYQYQQQPMSQGGGKKAVAIIGMIVGIVSIVLCCLNIIDIFIAVAGLILSIIGVKGSKRGCAIAGIICSGIGLLSAVTVLIIGLAGISMAEDAGVDFDSYYTEDYDSFGDMYDDMYDDVYDGIYGDVYDDIEGYYE